MLGDEDLVFVGVGDEGEGLGLVGCDGGVMRRVEIKLDGGVEGVEKDFEVDVLVVGFVHPPLVLVGVQCGFVEVVGLGSEGGFQGLDAEYEVPGLQLQLRLVSEVVVLIEGGDSLVSVLVGKHDQFLLGTVQVDGDRLHFLVVVLEALSGLDGGYARVVDLPVLEFDQPVHVQALDLHREGVDHCLQPVHTDVVRPSFDLLLPQHHWHLLAAPGLRATLAHLLASLRYQVPYVA